MSTKRKLWMTSQGPYQRCHGSKAAVYRYVESQCADWAAGALWFQYLRVYVDLRDGRGWYLYEQIDLAE